MPTKQNNTPDQSPPAGASSPAQLAEARRAHLLARLEARRTLDAWSNALVTYFGPDRAEQLALYRAAARAANQDDIAPQPPKFIPGPGGTTIIAAD